MRLCDEVVTVYNARFDPERDADIWVGTVIRGVSWRVESVSVLTEGGLKAADRHVLRIPEGADAGGREYAAPGTYRRSEDVSGLWTLQKGDVIVAGDFARDGMTPARLREAGDKVLTVLGVTDNRRAPRGGHWRVVGG